MPLGNWIKPSENFERVSPIFAKEFSLKNKVKSATLEITALGVYEAVLNGKRVGNFIMAPGFTSYESRIQEQSYDITEMLTEENRLEVTVGMGWCRSSLTWENITDIWSDTSAICANIKIEYVNGVKECYPTDIDWQVARSNFLQTEIYHGETFDARNTAYEWKNSEVLRHSKSCIIDQEGEEVNEIYSLEAKEIIITPKGETVIDFGQNLTGYVKFNIKGDAGHIAEIDHAEVLDSDGNFYTENLRSAKQKLTYICNGENSSFKPHFTFYGFRYIRLVNWPCEVNLSDFTAVLVSSNIRKTGVFECSNPLLTKLHHNIMWGQIDNFLDIPTDCPQRDERFGWTGDAQVFIRAASYNFDVKKYFMKWLKDLSADQHENGSVPHVVPDVLKYMAGDNVQAGSAAWGDAAVICPWQIYLTYGDKKILQNQFESMKKWVDYVNSQCPEKKLWENGTHFGDWLGLDAKEGDYKGSTPENYIASAYFAYSTKILIKAARVIREDASEYEDLYERIVADFKAKYFENNALKVKTQTAHALALYFDLCNDKALVAKDLAQLVKDNNMKISTGFVGTPYILHALSDNGYTDIAYSLLLQEDAPSWLYPVKAGATTIWEHWDSIKPDGTMWSADMNSLNHYAYGAVADWMYGVMAGINIDEDKPGFDHIILKPQVYHAISKVNTSIMTKKGKLVSRWRRDNGKVAYSFEIPKFCTATIILGDETYEVGSGIHKYKI